MKKLVVLMVVMAMIASCALANFAILDKGTKISIQKVGSVLPVIDGKFDAAAWGEPVMVGTGKAAIDAYCADNEISREDFLTLTGFGDSDVLSMGNVGDEQDMAERVKYLDGVTVKSYLRWSEEFIYICSYIEGVGQSHYNPLTQDESGNIWQYDNVQYMFLVDVADEDNGSGDAEVGFSLSSTDGTSVKQRWTDANGGGNDNTIAKVEKSSNLIVYESRIPWVEAGFDDFTGAAGATFLYAECYNFNVPDALAFSSNPEGEGATRTAFEATNPGAILNGKHSYNGAFATLVDAPAESAPAVEDNAPAAEDNGDAPVAPVTPPKTNPSTSDNLVAAMVVLAIVAAGVMVVSVRKFSK